MRKSIILVSITALTLVSCAEEESASSDPVALQITVENISQPGSLVATDGSTHDIGLSPGIWVIHNSSWALLREAEPLLHPELENLAELGDAQPLINALDVRPLPEGVSGVGFFGNTSVGGGYSPIMPGDTVTLQIDAAPGQLLSFAVMLGISNDTLLSTEAGGIELFDDAGQLIEGERTEIFFFDMGTEVNEDLAIGENQPASANNVDAGEAENGTVQKVTDPNYPVASQTLKLIVQRVP